MKHGPSHLFPDHVVVTLTLQEYEAFSKLLEVTMKGEAIPEGVDRREGQRRKGHGRRTDALSRREDQRRRSEDRRLEE